WRKAHVRRLVRESYNRFGQDELEAVCAAVVRSITDAEGTASHADPRLRILSRLLEFLERHDEVVLEGCVSFRLRD
ncbi:MAG TPA: hypothetical protein DCM14_04320, partial [Clostridiales bacterium UBA8153]|nr:hypothetical protein [Clostridiales bacterium UBA8153]